VLNPTCFGRRIGFGIIGDFQFGRQTPEPLEIIIAAGLLAENVHDEAAEVEQGPFGGALALAVFRRAAEMLVELLLDFRADGLHLWSAEAGANDEESVKAKRRSVEYGNPGGFFFFGGLDGEADTLLARIRVSRYRPCLRMYPRRRGNKSMNGLASMRAAANVGRGDFVRNVFEKIDGGALQVRDDLRRIPVFGFFLASGRAMRSGGMTSRRASLRIPGRLAMMKSHRRGAFRILSTWECPETRRRQL